MKYESSITYHSKAMANVKVFCGQTNRQTDKQTGQKLYVPDLTMWGHKNQNFNKCTCISNPML